MTSKQEQFIQDLVQFYRNKGIHNVQPAQFVARLNGKSVDLSDLYSLVLEYGGSYKVNQLNLWDEIFFKLFKTTYIGANFAVALRQIFNRYLLQYEKSCSGNFSSDQWNDDDDDENLFSNSNHNTHLHALPAQHYNSVTDSTGITHNDTKLYCSLLSGLPNELNFAFNIATILSNCNRFDWTNDYMFINVLLESIKSHCCVCDQYEEDVSFGKTNFTEEDEVCMLENLLSSSIRSKQAKEVKQNGDVAKNVNNCDEKKFSLPRKDKIEFIEQRCNCYSNYWHQICSDEEALSLVFEDDNHVDIDFDLPYVLKDLPVNLLRKMEQRIELIADIIRNISFTYDPSNVNKVSMIPLLKFLVLLLRSEKISYLNISLEILSNIAPSLSFSSRRPQRELYYYLLDVILKTIVSFALTSNNIYNTTKAFEIMARYLSCTNNDANSLLESHIDSYKLYVRVTHLLTCQFDITLLLALLEFCFIISEVRPCLLVNNESRTLIKLLVSLLNCEAAQHFTTGALKKIKILDERPRHEIASSNAIQNQSATPVRPPGSTIMTKQVPVASVAQNMIDYESFAINWLKSTYDEVPSTANLKVNDIYAEYVKYCCRNSRRNVIAAQSFNFLLKRCFPSIHINANQIVDGMALKGEGAKQITSAVVPQQVQLMSPILKAHLSTPPKNNAVPNETAQVQTAATTTTSTLIKSLLANKLRNNQQIISTSNGKPVISTVASSPTVLIQNNDKSDVNVTPTQNLIIANNPTTSFAITPTTINFPNNVIISNSSMQQPPHPGSQQILLVRTIIAAPGQQNQNTPVRLLVPASMITQQRFPAPVSVSNGITTTSIANNIIPTQASVIQTQLSIPQNTTTTAVSIAAAPPVSQQVATSVRNSISNSSPLLNVLLDKGKLPDFAASQTATTTAIVSTAPSTTTAAAVTSVQTIQANPSQPKMYILTTSPVKPPVVVQSQESISATTASNTIISSAAITASSDAKPDVKPQIATVNGDVKPTTNSPSTITSTTSDSLIKHALENAPIDNNKRLKTEHTESSIPNHVPEDSKEEVKPDPPVKSEEVTDSMNTVNSEDKPKIEQAKPEESAPVTPTEAAPPPPTPPKPEPVAEFECQWDNCHMKFVKPTEVFYHVHSYHVMTASFPAVMNCLWGGPEGKGPGCLSKRPKLSLLTHLQDFHCNPSILKQELLRKKQLSITGSTNIVLPQPPAHPGYAQNAAMLAIRRHSTNYYKVNPQKVTPLTPLTVSIRLTSALIIRNLAKRSQFIKKSLELFESELCEISISEGRDESRTVAQCLAILNESK